MREPGQHDNFSNAERRLKMMQLFQDAAKSQNDAEESGLEVLTRAAPRNFDQMEEEFNQEWGDVRGGDRIVPVML